MDSLDTSAWRQPKAIISLVGIILLTGIITVAILRDRIVGQPQWQVNVTGQGKVSYQPDTAEVTIGIQVDRAYSAQLAMKQLSDKMDKIIAAIKAADVPGEDITTQNFSLYPQYDYRDGVQTSGGYSANQQVIVKVKDLNNSKEKLAQVIGDATKAGANQIVGINFSVSNLEELKQQARVKAILDAKGKAGSLADAAGVRLGKVVGWWENVIQAPGVPYYGDRAMGIGGGEGGSTPTVPAGEQEIVVEVTVNYKVK